MMPRLNIGGKLTPELAEENGYRVVKSRYPWRAYQAHWPPIDVYTDTEAALLEALDSCRVFVQDCIERGGPDRASIGNLMAARDTIDKALDKLAQRADGPLQAAGEGER